MLFSVITVNRNNAEGLERTIKSVAAQDKSLYEYIIIDGASSDKSVDVVRKRQKHVDYFVSEPDKGIYNAMNKGIRQAKGEYVICMNSGDEFASPDALAQVAKHQLGTDFVFCGWYRAKGGMHTAACLPEKAITLYELYYHSMCVCHQATFTRRAVLEELGGYDEQNKIVSDVCFLMKALILHAKTYKSLPIFTTLFDITGLSGSNHGSNIISQEKTARFKEMFPYVYADYFRMHSVLRFAPSNVLRYIKWRLSKGK